MWYLDESADYTVFNALKNISSLIDLTSCCTGSCAWHGRSSSSSSAASLPWGSDPSPYLETGTNNFINTVNLNTHA